MLHLTKTLDKHRDETSNKDWECEGRSALDNGKQGDSLLPYIKEI